MDREPLEGDLDPEEWEAERDLDLEEERRELDLDDAVSAPSLDLAFRWEPLEKVLLPPALSTFSDDASLLPSCSEGTSPGGLSE